MGLAQVAGAALGCWAVCTSRGLPALPVAAAASFTGISQGVAGATVVPREVVAKLVNFLRLSWTELHDHARFGWPHGHGLVSMS